MIPPTVSVFAVVVTVGDVVNVTAPVPRLRLLVPMKVKLEAHVCALLLLSVIGLPEVLSIVPPLIVNVPVPTAVALLMFSFPADSVIPPVNVFAPESVSVPAPALVKLKVAPEITPPTVNVLAETVTLRLAPSATAPGPRFNAFVPVKVKSPPHV